jgi:predicted alternative tryptophan synthase beta-subunit
VATLLALLLKEKVMRAVAVRQNPVFEAAVMFAQAEGIVRLRRVRMPSGRGSMKP